MGMEPRLPMGMEFKKIIGMELKPNKNLTVSFTALSWHLEPNTVRSLGMVCSGFSRSRFKRSKLDHLFIFTLY